MIKNHSSVEIVGLAMDLDSKICSLEEENASLKAHLKNLESSLADKDNDIRLLSANKKVRCNSCDDVDFKIKDMIYGICKEFNIDLEFVD